MKGSFTRKRKWKQPEMTFLQSTPWFKWKYLEGLVNQLLRSIPEHYYRQNRGQKTFYIMLFLISSVLLCLLITLFSNPLVSCTHTLFGCTVGHFRRVDGIKIDENLAPLGLELSVNTKNKEQYTHKSAVLYIGTHKVKTWWGKSYFYLICSSSFSRKYLKVTGICRCKQNINCKCFTFQNTNCTVKWCRIVERRLPFTRKPLNGNINSS